MTGTMHDLTLLTIFSLGATSAFAQGAGQEWAELTREAFSRYQNGQYGEAEVAAKTGEGDPRGSDGRVETGPEYVSILDGMTGRQRARDDWPSRQIPGEPYRYNYSSRNQICVAYLDGKTPCLVVGRGTYTTIRLVAYQFHDDKLHRLWSWDSREETGRGRYNSQGAHIMPLGWDHYVPDVIAAAS